MKLKLKWDDRYNMGIEEFDHDHRQLFDIVKRLMERLENGGIDDKKQRAWVLREGRKYIQSYWIRHARAEEVYMRKIGYPDYTEHKNAHDLFLEHSITRWDLIQTDDDCTKEVVFKFLGDEVGWILEHIITMDMAIVGKGYLSQPKITSLSKDILVEQMDILLKSMMNIDFQVKIQEDNYHGGNLEEPVFHLITYKKDGQPLTLAAGMEKKFIIESVKSIYEGEVSEYEALIMATVDVFSATFWNNLGKHVLVTHGDIQFVGSRIQTAHHVQEQFTKNPPKLSFLFNTTVGNFCVISSYPFSAIQ